METTIKDLILNDERRHDLNDLVLPTCPLHDHALFEGLNRNLLGKSYCIISLCVIKSSGHLTSRTLTWSMCISILINSHLIKTLIRLRVNPVDSMLKPRKLLSICLDRRKNSNCSLLLCRSPENRLLIFLWNLINHWIQCS